MTGSPGPRRFLLVVGAMKAGTTSLHRYLARHPAVAPATPSEPNYFADDDHYADGFDAYQAHWDWDPDEHEWALEKTVDYTKRPRYPLAAERIRETVDARELDVHLVYVVRDPLARIESHATHEATRTWGHDDPFEMEGSEGRWLEPSMYARQLAPYDERFPRERIQVINFEDLKADPAAVTASVLDAVGLETAPAREVGGEAHNRGADRTVKHPLLRGLEAVGADRFSGLLPERARRGINDLLRDPLDERYELTDEQRAFLASALAQDLRELERDWGVDVDRWDVPRPDDDR